MSVVIDASMTLAWVFVDEHTDATKAAIKRVMDDHAFVPSLWHLEVANALWIALRRGRCDEEHVRLSLADLASFAIITDGETEKHAWGRTRELSLQHQLSVYDAAYLELAIRRRATLATLDRALAEAARRTGLDVIAN